MQTRQLASLLRDEGASVELVQVNLPYRPQWIGKLRGIRAAARLIPYLFRLWQAAGRAHVFHVMANSGWAWHLFAAPAVWIARLRGVPVIVNYRGGNAAEFFARSFSRLRPTLNAAHRVVVPSGFLQEVFRRHGLDAEIIPNIIDLSRFSPGAAGPADAPHIAVTRNLEPLYGIDTALAAFRLLLRNHPGARMTIAGSGPQRAELEALAEKLGIAGKVCFAGLLEREQIVALYRSARIALNPSRVDNMPNSVLEALACGVPVVSTDVGGVPYVVEHGRTALLVPAGDAEAMAAAMLRVLSEPGLASSLAEAGLRQARRYDWPVVRNAWLEAYRTARESMPARMVGKGVTR